MAEGVFFRVDGADIQTGDETFLVLRAASSDEAEELARKQGLLIASVRPAAPEDWSAEPGDAATSNTPSPIALADERPPRLVDVSESTTPAIQAGSPAAQVKHSPGTTHNGLSVFANGQALAAQATAAQAMARPSTGTAVSGNVMRTVPPSPPPTKPAASVIPVTPPANPTPSAPTATAPRPLATVRPPIPPRRPPVVTSPAIASPKPHGVVAQNRARTASSAAPPQTPPARPTQVVAPAKPPPPLAPMPPAAARPIPQPQADAPVPPPIPVTGEDIPPPPVPPALAEAPFEPQPELPASETTADVVDLSPTGLKEAPQARIWEHASSLVAGAVVLTPPRIEPPTPFPAPSAPTVARPPRTSETASVIAPAPSASGWVVTVLLCPLALLAIVAGVALPVYYTLNHPEPAGATDVQKIDLHLQSLDQYFLGGALVLAGLLLFMTAGLVYIGGIMKSLRRRQGAG